MIPFKTRIKSGVVQRLEVIESLSYQGNEIVPGAATDELAKVSSNDTTAGYLNGKLVAGSGIVLTENNNGGNETLTISANAVDLDVKVSVSANDTTAGYLNGKLVAGTGITFTENNNGGDETLTVTLAAHTHAASDVTSGVFGTARLATTGTASSSTYLRGDQSWSGLDAGHITAGTVPTARLGSGTANSTTYLRGDQTWATISAGDTTYAMTLTDVENTTAQIDLVSFTVPGNTWANGEIITLDIWYHLNNTSGIQRTLTNFVFIAGTQADSVIASVAGSNIRYGLARFMFWRDGSVIRIYNDTRSGGSDRYWAFNELARPSFNASLTSNPYDLQDYTSVTPSSFASNIVLKIAAQWGGASAATYLRTLNARAYKLAGQQT